MKLTPSETLAEVERQQNLKDSAPEIRYVQALFNATEDANSEILLLQMKLERVNNKKDATARALAAFEQHGSVDHTISVKRSWYENWPGIWPIMKTIGGGYKKADWDVVFFGSLVGAIIPVFLLALLLGLSGIWNKDTPYPFCWHLFFSILISLIIAWCHQDKK